MVAVTVPIRQQGNGHWDPPPYCVNVLCYLLRLGEYTDEMIRRDLMNLVEKNRMARRTVSSEVSGKGWVSGGRDESKEGSGVMFSKNL